MKAKNLLISKSKVCTLFSDVKIKEAIETMRKVGYTMIPVIDRKTGKYVFSISDGDILATVIDDKGLKCLKKKVSDIEPARFIAPSKDDAEIEDLVDLLANQNYVPLVDDSGVFKGIVTRKSLIYSFFTKK